MAGLRAIAASIFFPRALGKIVMDRDTATSDHSQCLPFDERAATGLFWPERSRQFCYLLFRVSPC